MEFPKSNIPQTWSLYCLEDPTAYTKLENATHFTRLQTRLSSEELDRALIADPALKETFCLAHAGILLIFDSDEQTHKEHIRTVFEMLQHHNTTVVPRECIYNAPDAASAGFRLRKDEGGGEDACGRRPLQSSRRSPEPSSNIEYELISISNESVGLMCRIIIARRSD